MKDLEVDGNYDNRVTVKSSSCKWYNNCTLNLWAELMHVLLVSVCQLRTWNKIFIHLITITIWRSNTKLKEKITVGLANCPIISLWINMYYTTLVPSLCVKERNIDTSTAFSAYHCKIKEFWWQTHLDITCHIISTYLRSKKTIIFTYSIKLSMDVLRLTRKLCPTFWDERVWLVSVICRMAMSTSLCPGRQLTHVSKELDTAFATYNISCEQTCMMNSIRPDVFLAINLIIMLVI